MIFLICQRHTGEQNRDFFCLTRDWKSDSHLGLLIESSMACFSALRGLYLWSIEFTDSEHHLNDHAARLTCRLSQSGASCQFSVCDLSVFDSLIKAATKHVYH